VFRVRQVTLDGRKNPLEFKLKVISIRDQDVALKVLKIFFFFPFF